MTNETDAPSSPAAQQPNTEFKMRMPYINQKRIAGYVGSDPVSRRMASGESVVSISVGTVHSYKDSDDKWQDSTEWHQVAFYRKLAEEASALLSKGSGVYVEGRMHTRSWLGDDQRPRKASELIAERFFPVSLSVSQSGQAANQPQGPREQAESATPQPKPRIAKSAARSNVGFDTPS